MAHSTMIRILFIMLSTFPALIASRNGYGNLFIDCGASQESNVSNFIQAQWQTDEEFIKSGENKQLTSNQSQTELNTLRYFPKGKKNCYKLQFYYSDQKYIFRAGFYYGNYDGLSKPPSFVLEIDGHVWANVTTSMSDEPSYYEIVYYLKKGNVQVCLVRLEDDEIPFISSLEAINVYDNMYTLMDTDTALYLHQRINFGANKSVEGKIGYFQENLRRVWKSEQMSDYLNIQVDEIPFPFGSVQVENDPPWPVIGYAIQAKNLTDSISLSFDFSPRSSVQAYFVLYLSDPIFRILPPNVTSKVEIYIDNNKMATNDIPNYGNSRDPCHVLSFFQVPITGSSANLTIAPAEGSTLAPILNAIEVFSAIDASSAGRKSISLTVSMFFMALLFS